MFRSILVPLDGSLLAEGALPTALSIAQRCGASVDLVSTHAVFQAGSPTICWGPYYDPAQDAALKEQSQAYLDAVAKRLRRCSPVPLTSAVIEGAVVDGVLERARAVAANLIVMTTHGRGAMSRFWLGSTADSLMRQSSIPILLLRSRDRLEDRKVTPDLQRILIPLDGSELAERVLGPAVALGKVVDANYTLLRAVEPDFHPYRFPNPGDVGQTEQRRVTNVTAAEKGWKEERRARAVRYLDGVAMRLRGESLCVNTQVVECDASSALLRYANGFHLVAIATHGRGGFKRLLLGSVADKVIRGTVTPVLVYRPGGE